MLKFLALAASSLVVAGIAFVPLQASADDNVFMLSVGDVMSMPDAKEQLDGSVQFFFGGARHPGVAHSYGDFVSNEKTNALGKSAQFACSWATLHALQTFQKRAHELGANAVINIHSFYKKEDFSSDSQIQCHTGFLIAGVALKGDFVSIR